MSTRNLKRLCAAVLLVFLLAALFYALR